MSQIPTPIAIGAKTEITKTHIDPCHGYSEAVVQDTENPNEVLTT